MYCGCGWKMCIRDRFYIINIDHSENLFVYHENGRSNDREKTKDIGESENYKLRHTLQAGVSIRNEFESER